MRRRVMKLKKISRAPTLGITLRLLQYFVTSNDAILNSFIRNIKKSFEKAYRETLRIFL